MIAAPASRCVHFVRGECSLLIVRSKVSTGYSFTVGIYLLEAPSMKKVPVQFRFRSDSNLPAHIFCKKPL